MLSLSRTTIATSFSDVGCSLEGVAVLCTKVIKENKGGTPSRVHMIRKLLELLGTVRLITPSNDTVEFLFPMLFAIETSYDVPIINPILIKAGQ